MSKRLIDFDPVTGIAHYSQWDEIDDAFRYHAVQEAQPILDANKAEAAEAPSGFRKDGLTKVASIPMPLWYDLKKRGIIDDRKKLEAWLRDPDNRMFLTRSGKII